MPMYIVTTCLSSAGMAEQNSKMLAKLSISYCTVSYSPRMMTLLQSLSSMRTIKSTAVPVLGHRYSSIIMPVSLEQWRAAVGAWNGRRLPNAQKHQCSDRTNRLFSASTRPCFRPGAEQIRKNESCETLRTVDVNPHDSSMSVGMLSNDARLPCSYR